MSETPETERNTSAQRSYAGDGPVRTEAEDELGRYPFARTLAESIASHPDDDCLVIGLYAPWGAGKTSLLNFLARELESNDHIVLFRFNPWRYSGEDSLLEQFYNGFGEALTVKLKRWYERTAVRTAATGVASAGAIAGALSDPSLAAAEPVGTAIKGLANKLTAVTVEQLKKRLMAELQAKDLRVVVLIDDLDRLEANEIHAILRLVRLNADFPRTTYVIASDREVVGTTLAQRFQGDITAGHAFLEKIVQVPLHLPPADPSVLRNLWLHDVADTLLQVIGTVDAASAERLVKGFHQGIWSSISTPRQVKRHVNVIQFVARLTKGHVNAVDIVLLEACRMVFPKLYGNLQGAKEALLGTMSRFDLRTSHDRREPNRQALTDLLSHVADSSRREAELLLGHLFPYVASLTTSATEPKEENEEWLKQKRICTHEYFDRHFALGVPDGDISDEAVVQFGDLLVAGDVAGAKAWCETNLTPSNGHLILRKMESTTATATGTMAANAARMLAQVGHFFSGELEELFFSPRMIAAGVVGSLLHRIDDRAARLQAGLEVVSEPVDLDVAVKVFESLAIYEERNRHRAAFDEAEQGELLTRLIARLKSNATEALAHPGPALAKTLWAWGRSGSPQSATAWFKEVYSDDPVNLDRVLLSFAGGSWEVESGRTKPQLGREGFEQLISAISADKLAKYVQERFASILTIAADNDRAVEELESAALVAWQFYHLYLHSSRSRGGDPASQPDGS